MRASGKTTRAVDEAIQFLFENGKIHIPYREDGLRGTTLKEGYDIVDPDYFKGYFHSVQTHLQRVVIKRLASEHPNKVLRAPYNKNIFITVKHWEESQGKDVDINQYLIR